MMVTCQRIFPSHIKKNVDIAILSMLKMITEGESNHRDSHNLGTPQLGTSYTEKLKNMYCKDIHEAVISVFIWLAI